MSYLKYALAIDIDGVLIRGKKSLPMARDALIKLNENKIPYILLTNGGGMTEKKKSEQLTKILNYNINYDDIILSHTPMKTYLAPLYSDKRVMIVGSLLCAEVAKSYGFQKIITPKQFFLQNPFLYPHRSFNKNEKIEDPFQHEPIEAVMVFHDPDDWALEMQILSDVLYTGWPCGTSLTGEQLPFYVSNPDFIYSAEHNIPRFAQAAFTDAFSHLYEKMHNSKLKVKRFGKPMKITYDFCVEKLLNKANKLGYNNTELNEIYGIGDNPAADVRGANNAGDNWKSILVKTGIYQDDNEDLIKNDPPDFIFDHIGDVVDWLVNKK